MTQMMRMMARTPAPAVDTPAMIGTERMEGEAVCVGGGGRNNKGRSDYITFLQCKSLTLMLTFSGLTH